MGLFPTLLKFKMGQFCPMADLGQEYLGDAFQILEVGVEGRAVVSIFSSSPYSQRGQKNLIRVCLGHVMPPFWPHQPWFWALRDLAQGHVIPLPEIRNLISMGVGGELQLKHTFPDRLADWESELVFSKEIAEVF